MTEPAPERHPLFPIAENADEEEEGREVCFIQVNRREASGLVTAPEIFPGQSLTSLTQLHELYGGGIYELIGRGVGNARIVARRSYTLPGPSRPMFKLPEAEAPPAAPPVDVSSLLAAARAQQSGGMNLQTIIALLAALAPVITQYLQNSAQTAQQQHAAQQNFLATLLSQSQAQSDKFVSVMQSLHTNAASGGTVASGPGGTEFQKGVKWMEDFIAGQMEEKGGDGGDAVSLNELVKLASAGLEALKHNQAAAPLPAASAASGPTA